MAGLPSFLRKSKTSPEDKVYGNEATRNVSMHTNNSAISQRRLSRRNFFGSFMRSNTYHNRAKATSTRADPARPHPPNANKPLPPPPPGAEGSTAPKSGVTRQLNRIMTSFTIADVHKLFSGAPQFFCRSELRGVPWPSVAFPWDVDIGIKNIKDHREIEDEAWSLVTAAKHITRDMRKERDVIDRQLQEEQTRFDPECFERPNMISCQGLERGTMGYSAALQIGIADELFAPEPQNSYLEPLMMRRHDFLRDKRNGLRILDELDIVNRLAELGELYQDSLVHTSTNIDMYHDLFTKELWPPARVIEPDDPYCLRVQVESLVSVLTMEHIWYDFSLVEWRLRLGQLLWERDVHDSEIDLSRENSYLQEPGWQRFWLLLQLLLAIQLVVRLDISKTQPGRYSETVSHINVMNSLEERVATSLAWSMLLARRWLENIKITPPVLPNQLETKATPSATWSDTLMETAVQGDLPQEDTTFVPATYTGRYQVRQLQGLLHFAREIEWPRIDMVAARLTQSTTGHSGQNQALKYDIITSNSLKIQGSSTASFGEGQRRDIRRGLSKQNRIQATLQNSGWLSSSYLNGLILPGEAFGHLLISTLLESDDAAITQLGNEVNLYGGFVYAEKSFWSTSCIIGRVLAADKTAKECMCWVSTSIMPKGVKNSWINVEVEVAPQDVDYTLNTSRIWNTAVIERDSHVLGTSYGHASLVLPGDFSVPTADPIHVPMQVNFLGLDLFAADSGTPSIRSLKGDRRSETLSTINNKFVHNYIASMRFALSGLETSLMARGDHEIDIELKYDIHFVTAHPCVPNANINQLLRPSSASTACDSSSILALKYGENPHDLFEGHALHASFSYIRLNIRDVLIPPPNQDNSRGRSDPLANFHTHSSEVVIVDCVEFTQPFLPVPLISTSRAAAPQISSRAGTPISQASNSPGPLDTFGKGSGKGFPPSTTEPFSTLRHHDYHVLAVRPASSRSYKPDAAISHQLTPLSPPAYSNNALLRPMTAPPSDSHTAPSLKPIVSKASVASSHPAKSETAKSESLDTLLRLDRKGKGSDVEMLARAWCAERGYNAVISRKGRNCIACSIREARALGWKVVLRFE